MNAHLSVSVIMATYNGERFIAGQLESLTRQTHRPLEIIVSDDGSSDGTRQIVADFSRSSPVPIKLLVNPVNVGYADNFLSAASLAQGDLLAFCDQDDIWLPNKLEECAKPFADDRIQLSVHTAELIDEAGATVGYLAQGISRTGPLAPLRFEPWGVFMGFSVLFRRNLLDLMPADQRGPEPFNPSKPLSHDRWAYFLATSAGGVFAIQTPLVKYRQHSSNVFGSRGGVWTAKKYRSILSMNRSDARLRSSAHLEIARNRLSLLENAILANPGNAAVCRSLANARERWKRFHFAMSQRQNMFDFNNRSARLRKWMSNLTSGIYSETAGMGAGIMVAIRDAIIAFR